MKKKLFFIFIFLNLQNAMAIEEPAFQVISRDAKIEIRQYTPFIVAQTYVDGDMDDAGNQGFRRIADFIFGNNQTPGSDTSNKIAMTAPVTMEPRDANATMKSANKWRVHFVMPKQYTMANIPKPKNNAVELAEVSEKYYAVLTYSGFNTLNRVQEKTTELMEWLKEKSITPKGTPQLSRYDPPWTLPMWRRNEIMIEISAPATN
jgi:hypothetical protein